MHCHPGFVEDCSALLCQAQRLGIGGFINVVTPGEFEIVSATLKDLESSYSCVEGVKPTSLFVAGIGIHPWWIDSGECGQAEIDQVIEVAQNHPFIGEVGLDFGVRFKESDQIQQDAFARIVKAALQNESSLVSVHSSRAAAVVLDCLEEQAAFEAGSGMRVIFHWFSGTSEELQCAIKAGCYFSVNKRMLNSKRGKEYAKQIPADRLLLESDLPGDKGDVFSAQEWRAVLEDTLAQLAEIKGEDIMKLGQAVAGTSEKLLLLQG